MIAWAYAFFQCCQQKEQGRVGEWFFTFGIDVACHVCVGVNGAIKFFGLQCLDFLGVACYILFW